MEEILSERLAVLQQTKRDLLVALAMGCLLELGIWYPVFQADSEPATAGSHTLLEKLQEPGVRVACFVAGNSFKLLKLHWSKHPPSYAHIALRVLGYLASGCGFIVLIAMWGVVAFAVLRMVGTKVGRLTLLILGILLVIGAAFEFLIGVQIPLNPTAAVVFGIVLVVAAAKRGKVVGVRDWGF